MMDDYGISGDPDGLAYDLAVARGMKSERISQGNAAESISKAIAAGEADSATMCCWVEHVAKKVCSEIVDNDAIDDSQRGSKALIATGLYGKSDEFRELRSLIDIWLDFGEITATKTDSEWDLKPPMIVRAFRSRGFFDGVKDRAAAETARRQLNLVRADRKQR